jgi:HEAT repeat protein
VFSPGLSKFALFLALLVLGCGEDARIRAKVRQLVDPACSVESVARDLQAHGERAVPALIDATRSRDPELRKHAVYALLKLGPKAETAIPDIEELLHDEAVEVRRVAVTALAYVAEGSKAADVVPAVATVVADPDPEARGRACYALSRLHASPDVSVPALLSALRDADSDVRREAAHAVAAFGGAARDAAPALHELLESQEPHDRSAAIFGLAGITPPEEGAAIVAPLLDDASPEVRAAAARATGRIGPPAAALVPRLLQLLDDESEHVQADAAMALGAMGSAAEAAVPRLARLLESDVDFVRERAGVALEQIGSSGALKALVDALKHPRGNVRLEAVRALGAMGPKAAPALEALEIASDDMEADVSSEAESAVAEIRRAIANAPSGPTAPAPPTARE